MEFARRGIAFKKYGLLLELDNKSPNWDIGICSLIQRNQLSLIRETIKEYLKVVFDVRIMQGG